MKRRIIWVNYKARGQWVVVLDSEELSGLEPKKDAIRAAVHWAKTSHTATGDVFTIKIRASDGSSEIREERTIPRGSDPRRSRG